MEAEIRRRPELMIWRCPACKGELFERAAALVCSRCNIDYPVVGGVPDFRPPDQRAGDEQRFVDAALAIATGPAAGDRDALIRAYFVSRESPLTGGPEYTRKRIDGTRDGFKKLERETSGWLKPIASADGVILDVGCGLGATIAAFSKLGRRSAGIDNRLDLLIITRAIFDAAVSGDASPEVAAADAMSLPLADESLGAIVYYDVVEHLPQMVPAAMREAQRVTSGGGWLAISTPNRFSLAAEPHVGVWGVGWLPRRFQALYARRRSGIDYTGTLLLSAREVARIIATNTDFQMTFDAPLIPVESIEAFQPRRARLARAYNSVGQRNAVRDVMLQLGPFFHAIGRRRQQQAEAT
jgi:SAM-dependent methyltransferase/uncharacterized protein YbaR (Trm112 family)